MEIIELKKWQRVFRIIERKAYGYKLYYYPVSNIINKRLMSINYEIYSGTRISQLQ